MRCSAILRGKARVPSIQEAASVSFFCCDLQEKFENRIPDFRHSVHVANRFAAAADAFNDTQGSQKCNFVVTEQYPKGLGHTVPGIKMPPWENRVLNPFRGPLG